MTNAPADKKSPLSHSAHELRNSLSVVLGYIGFVLRDKKSEVSGQHREWLEVSRKACGRLTDIINEMSDLAHLQSGETTLNRTPTDLRALLAQAVAALPVPDREIDVELSTGDGPAVVQADAPKLKAAFTSIVAALRHEAVTSTKLIVQERSGQHGGKPVSWIVIGSADQIETLRHAAPESLATFDKSRGNSGMRLWIAAHVLNAHGGAIWSPAEPGKTAAVVMVPVA